MIILAFIVAMILGLLAPIDAKEPNIEVKATCWLEIGKKYCKLRTLDDAIYWDGKWHSNYFIEHTTENNNGLHLLVKEKR